MNLINKSIFTIAILLCSFLTYSTTIIFNPTSTVVEVYEGFESPTGNVPTSFSAGNYSLSWSTSGSATINNLQVFVDGTSTSNGGFFFKPSEFGMKIIITGWIDQSSTHCQTKTINFTLRNMLSQVIATGSHTIKVSEVPGSTYGPQPSGAELIIQDYTNDKGYVPNNNTKWAEMFQSPGVWNRLYDDDNETHQNPDYSQGNPPVNYNQVYAKIWNIGCTAFSDEDAELHLYWTRARTGEKWKSHWLHYSNNDAKDNYIEDKDFPNIHYPAGGEITISDPNDYSSSPSPLAVQDIDPG